MSENNEQNRGSLHRLAIGAGAAVALVAAAGAASAGGCGSFSAYAIYTEIPGTPSAVAPGLGVDFTALLSLYTSPNGDHWIFKAFIDDSENDVIVVGSGDTGFIAARENDPTPVPGTVHSFLDSDCGINNSGQFVYGSRLEGATAGTDEVIFRDNGSVLAAVIVEGNPAQNLVDPLGAGDEIFGNSLNSAHILSNGRVCFRADQIGNIDSDFRSALYHGMNVRSQEGTNAAEGEAIDSFAALSGNTFSSSADGTVWVVEADILPGLGSDEAVLVNNEVMIRDGDILPGAALPVDGVFGVDVDDVGNWFARGDFPDDTDWVVRNDAVIAMTGMPIFPGSSETWGAVITGANGLGNDYIVTGDTSEGRQVLVLNGTEVIAASGDPVLVDGAPNAVIATFSPEDIALTLGGAPLAFVTLEDSVTGAALGDAFISWAITAGCSVADLAAPCGVLDLQDINAFIIAFVAQDPIADIAAPNGVWDLGDIGAFVNGFLNGCP